MRGCTRAPSRGGLQGLRGNGAMRSSVQHPGRGDVYADDSSLASAAKGLWGAGKEDKGRRRRASEGEARVLALGLGSGALPKGWVMRPATLGEMIAADKVCGG